MASASFVYDGGLPLGIITVYVTNATIGETYDTYASDPSSSGDSQVAATSSLTLTITSVGGFPANGSTFDAVAGNSTTGVIAGATVFAQGTPNEYPNVVTWAYDGVTTVTATFVSVSGRAYNLDVFDFLVGSNCFGVGTGAEMTISCDYSPTVFPGTFMAELFWYDGSAHQYISDRLFAPGVANTGFGGNPVATGSGTCDRVWRFVVSDLQGEPITILDSLASERTVTPKLNEPLEVSGTVPSDNSEVNLLHTDGFPFLAEGVRQLYCFRRESDTSPFYTIRASTLVLQVDDAARSDDARSRFTAWDPWQYLFSRPVLQSSLATVGKAGGAGVDGELITDEGLWYPISVGADDIIVDILNIAAGAADPGAPLATQECFIDRVNGTIETCSSPSVSGPWMIQQGTSIGQAFQDIVATGVCDIVLTPIYDSTRPGILCELDVYTQSSPANGAGVFNYGAVFAWDRPGRSMVGVDNLYDGVGRANTVQFYSGQGGPPVPRQTDSAAIATYGEYWAQQFFPATPENLPAAQALAAEQLVLRKSYKETLTVNPAPERSPEPFVDYYLGDRVPVYVSNRMRQELPAGVLPFAWQRVYGIPVSIDDNGVETVRELLVGPVGGPPPVEGGAAGFGAPAVNSQVPITTARNRNHGGRIIT